MTKKQKDAKELQQNEAFELAMFHAKTLGKTPSVVADALTVEWNRRADEIAKLNKRIDQLNAELAAAKQHTLF